MFNFTYEDWNIEEETGYKPISTFYSDLSIAEHYGVDAIKDTYKRVCKYWIKDYKMFTEFVMALNWKSYRWYNHKEELCKLYVELYEKAYDLAMKNFNKEEKEYFYRTTD